MSSKSNIHSTIFRKMFITYHPSNPTLFFDTLVTLRHILNITVIFRTGCYVSNHQSSFDQMASFGPPNYVSVKSILRSTDIFRLQLCFDNYVSTTSIFRHISVTSTTVTISETLNMLTAVNNIIDQTTIMQQS